VGIALYFLIYLAFGRISWAVHGVLVILLFFPALKLCSDGERFYGKKDPPEVVIDEVLGIWISLLFHPFSVIKAVLAFFIFRILDILKPFPAGRAQGLKGGLGVMMDDVVAGIYTNLIIFAISIVFKQVNIPI
jgi:phosphatidylglycerophosphatase A